MTKELLSVKDIMQLTGWSKSTVYILIKNGDLPTVKLPKAPIRVHKNKFLELINEQ